MNSVIRTKIQVVAIDRELFMSFEGNADALMLDTFLRLADAGAVPPFEISDTAMSERNVLPGWNLSRYRNACIALLRMWRIEIAEQIPHKTTIYGLPDEKKKKPR